MAVRRGRPWGVDDRTGGLLDAVWEDVRARVPGLVVERLTVKHAGDDDNVYFVGVEDSFDLVQLDCLPGGQPPFLIEGNDDPTAEVGEAAVASALLVTLLEKAPNASGSA